MYETKHRRFTVAEAKSALFKKTPTLAKRVEFIYIYIYETDLCEGQDWCLLFKSTVHIIYHNTRQL